MTEPDRPPAEADEADDIDDLELSSPETGELEAAPENLRRGVEVIRSQLRHLPNAPGVYRMFDGAGEVLYVGKARSLKKRVANYARGIGHNTRIARMIAETCSMEFVSTETETEALLLEANLIKRLRPRYNVLLRDDKSFPYILIATDHPAPQIAKHRGARVRKGDYFGPFASAGAVGRTINALERAFLLRSCSDSYFEGRTRPCLLFQIKRCSAPCTGEITPQAYAELVQEARDFLTGKTDKVKQELAHAMEQASETLDFERAAVYRDRLAALAAIQSHQGVNPRTVEEADVFAIHAEGGQTCVEAFFFRAYQNWGARAYFPKADRSLEPREVLGSFVAQFYDAEEPPRLVLLSEEIEDRALLAEALSIRSGRRVEVSVPARGEKRDLVARALANAREALGRRLAETSTQAKLLAGVAEAFGLPSPPQRIEVYDNSHIMGTAAVGAMIVAGPEGFQKNHYRKFNIRPDDITPGDDTAMMRQVLRRRFARLQKESPRDAEGRTAQDAPPWPDLVMIDGGQGQLTAARETLAELGLADAPLVGIAKGVDREAGRETFFVEGKTPFRLPPRDPVLYYVQRLRDEAHRFAIGTHRARRSKEFVANPLDEVPGVGPTRKRALLRHFGTAKAVARAGLADLEKAPGVSKAMAKVIYDFFHERGDRG
ncbi:excinuclease ABC subunit UvrC [Hansschlegelia beijingensis]|uniref:UvrABC system protein C n=1 Tax=Hansschlegelia beijingensis TaxID=1133344 RepID=A0A7W6GDW7_9HYPH|nr:excinuclease ABC subunit UvrC [Hansschlegelia beijingensis]MBB3971570.1 excinuclease ABC subunit C [Hansschlegelia beijingensis]